VSARDVSSRWQLRFKRCAALPAAASFSDTTAVAGTVYTYTVKARTAAGNSASSAADTGWRNVAAPAGVNATDGTLTTGVTVTWTAVAGATGHKVFRAVGTGAAAEIASLGATAATHTDATAVAGTVYTYTVRAVTAAGTSAASAANTGWRNVAAPAGVSATDGTSTANVTVTWTAVPGAAGHKVFRATGTAAATLVATLGATAATYADTTAVAGTVYTYTVKATTAAGESAVSTANTGWRNVAAPAGLAATDGGSVASGLKLAGKRNRRILVIGSHFVVGEAMIALVPVAAARPTGKRRIFIAEVADWLAKHFQPDPDDYRRAGLPVPISEAKP
jgi:hypothetical protein